MNKKLLLASLIAATLSSANVMAKNPHPSDTDPVTGLCSLFQDGNVFLSWDDQLDEGEKYGGDLEIDFSVDYACVEPYEEGVLNLSVEIELDMDEEAILSYGCDGSVCNASAVFEGDMGWENEVLAAAEAAVLAACGADNIDSVGAPSYDRISFSVKEMNPGPGKSQDKVKSKVEVWPEPDNVCLD